MVKKNKWYLLLNEICFSLLKFIEILNLLIIIFKFFIDKIDI